MRFKKNIVIKSILLFLSVGLLTLLIIGPKVKESPALVLYGVHANSPRIVKDDGSIEFADYVMIKNMTEHVYDLTGLYLSDSRNNLQKLPLEGIALDIGASQMIRLDPSWNFALKRSGEETVYLSDSRGNILFRYTPDMKPEEPILSAESGFYDVEFDLKMQVKGNYTIHYTLDGSEPDMSSPEYIQPIHIYDRSNEKNKVINVPNTVKNYLEDEVDGRSVEKPIEDPVDKSFVVRAVAMDIYGNKSEVVTGEFFFCKDKYRNIISVIADPDDVFGDYGIASVGKEYDDWYLGDREGESPTANFDKKGRDWEIPAETAYYQYGEKVFGQKCGLKLQGRTTRYHRNKNYQLRARNCYSGSDSFGYDFFDNEDYRSDGIILDNSFKESFFYSLVEGEEIIKQKTTGRCAFFLNGEFMGYRYLRQRLDEKYFADHYGINGDNLIVLSESFPEIGAEDDETLAIVRGYYIAIDEFALNNDLSIQDNYEKIQSMMDIDSYIDYLAINTWAGNGDWAEYENDMCWRVKTPSDDYYYTDGRFRWILHDGDTTFVDNMPLTNPSYIEASALLGNLMKNRQFREKLANRIIELGTTTFSDEHINAELSRDKWEEPEKQEIADFFLTRKDEMRKLTDELVK